MNWPMGRSPLLEIIVLVLILALPFDELVLKRVDLSLQVVVFTLQVVKTCARVLEVGIDTIVG